MFQTTRLRLTAWYLLIMAVIVGAISALLYRLVMETQAAELLSVHLPKSNSIANVFAHDQVTLAYQIIAVDLAVLVASGVGAYFLAGRTLVPIEEAVERQRRFAAAASHELRTPLTALQGNLEVALLSRRTPEEYEQILRDAVRDTDRMGHLVRDLTYLARPAIDTPLVHLVPMDLAEIAEAAVEDVRPLAIAKTQILEIVLNGELPVQGDIVTLRQLIVNLLENAISYTPPGGTIRLVGRREHGRAALEIRDTGVGIAPQHLPHLFEPFYQADRARSNKDHVGLGLSLATWIARAHGGQIRVASQVGVGSVFTVSFPLAPG